MIKTAATAAPLFSVIIPVYDCDAFLPRAVESVLAQTDPDWELIIVDDASHDRSGEIADEYARRDGRIRVIHNEENIHTAKSLNRGIRASAGSWIVRLDSDDAFEPHYLETIRPYAFSDQMFLSAWVSIIDEQDRKVLDIRLPRAGVIRRMMNLENFLYHPATSFSKNAWAQVGGYPERKDIAEDTAMWRKFFEAGMELHMIPQFLLNYRVHYANITSRNDARLSDANARNKKALRQNREWKISLFIKQGMLSEAREELRELRRLTGGYTLKNRLYLVFTYLPPFVSRVFMWEFRPVARAVYKLFFGPRQRV